MRGNTFIRHVLPAEFKPVILFYRKISKLIHCIRAPSWTTETIENSRKHNHRTGGRRGTRTSVTNVLRRHAARRMHDYTRSTTVRLDCVDTPDDHAKNCYTLQNTHASVDRVWTNDKIAKMVKRGSYCNFPLHQHGAYGADFLAEALNIASGECLRLCWPFHRPFLVRQATPG